MEHLLFERFGEPNFIALRWKGLYPLLLGIACESLARDLSTKGVKTECR